MFERKRKRIGDMLLQEGLISQEQLETALQEQKSKNKKLGLMLVELGYVTERQMIDAIQRQTGMEMIELRGINIAPNIHSLVTDSSLLSKLVAIPYALDEFDSSCLKVAMADPLDLAAIDDLATVTGMQITPVIASGTDILATIDRYYGDAANQAVAKLYASTREPHETQQETSDLTIENAPIVVLVSNMIEQAVRQRASDIHIEPMETKIRVRYRIDGVMHEVGSYQTSLLAAMVTRIKIIGGMDISEKRKPQDGRITQIVDRMEYDIRASILPTVFGEKVVMRLTSKMTLTKQKKNLGFREEEMEKFDRIFSNANGIILVTGPTGSGKSTTLYTALSELNKEDVNIVTVEDPVEANIDGINQVQVNPKADLTFASALRSILRQDPDIIMIGEIRDEETASIAVSASITGHLVVSTLHTNSAAASITRLADMGIEPYLIADSTVGVIAQRLVRRLCSCKKEHMITEEEKKLLGVTDDFMVAEACGCPKCNHTGYLGRIGVYEILPITAKIRNAINKRATTDEIEAEAIKEGMSTLHQSIVAHIRNKTTTIAEMKRIMFFNDED